MAELTRLACAAGGRRETLAGLSGLGDLVLTCTGSLSRNRHVGIELAQGARWPRSSPAMKMVAEGVITTGAALALGSAHGVELPIATQMAEVLERPRGRADRARRADAAQAARGGRDSVTIKATGLLDSTLRSTFNAQRSTLTVEQLTTGLHITPIPGGAR